MFEVIVSLALGTLVLGYVQWLYDKKRISSEVARKIIHICSGLIVISWPFFVSWRGIIVAEVIFFGCAFITRRLQLLSSQRSIDRKSWGEFFFSLGVVASVLVGAPRWIFILAILVLSFADTIAAFVGKRYGKRNVYKVFGQNKSVAGTAAFFLTTSLLMLLATLLVPTDVARLNLVVFLSLPFLTAAIENLGVFGLDNLLIPLSVVLLLSKL